VSPEELIRAAFDALNAYDLEGLLALMDPAIEIRSLAIKSRRGAWFHGYVGVRTWWEAVTATYDRMGFELRSLQVEGDRAVAELRARFVVGDVDVETGGWQSVRFRGARILTWARWETEAEARESVGMAGAQ
jgi:ketosteroid isomerase-like protein